MITALTLDKINDYCRSIYDYDEKHIIGIMIARYPIQNTKHLIGQQYDYWNYYTGKNLYIFWLGYGAYGFPNMPGQYLIENVTCEPNVYFDSKIFSQEIQNVERILKFNYKDTIGIFLCNYHDGRVYFNESVYIDLDEMIQEENYKIREFSTNLIKECKKNADISKVIFKMKIKQAKLNIKSSSIVSDSLSKIIDNLFGFIK